jgi:hypothetical protein
MIKNSTMDSMLESGFFQMDEARFIHNEAVLARDCVLHAQTMMEKMQLQSTLIGSSG